MRDPNVGWAACWWRGWGSTDGGSRSQRPEGGSGGPLSEQQRLLGRRVAVARGLRVGEDEAFCISNAARSRDRSELAWLLDSPVGEPIG